ncbi:hypothetical protein J7I93_15785 [Bacillus sp. ISL-47]|uniref:hypothetical protein n=1 Tax=Bacillus sp. ISL-47 TaxID=2819130 RepID=UPI001BEBF290|nr:hypothetical protein [Bacillus sp. ISL-47]MBT2689651.1 hypothetical protein [Bacillus sp. ISL-47]MBT2709296.1 hypothetical protein [Pseudomonas sp. ISL-84]
MYKKLIGLLIVFLLLFSFYELMVKTKTVRYMGEDENWYVEINSKLAGLNVSYTIEVRYKGKEKIQSAEAAFHPHYNNMSFPSIDKGGYIYWECRDDCGYYDKESELLFFIVWKEDGDLEEKMSLFKLRKMSSR